MYSVHSISVLRTSSQFLCGSRCSGSVLLHLLPDSLRASHQRQVSFLFRFSFSMTDRYIAAKSSAVFLLGIFHSGIFKYVHKTKLMNRSIFKNSRLTPTTPQLALQHQSRGKSLRHSNIWLDTVTPVMTLPKHLLLNQFTHHSLLVIRHEVTPVMTLIAHLLLNQISHRSFPVIRHEFTSVMTLPKYLLLELDWP